MSLSIDPQEIEKFSKIADKWWDEEGEFAPLHKMNPIRIKYIKAKLSEYIGEYKGKKALDIGCGGGLLSEPMSNIGLEMTSIDASERNIKVASLHAKENGLDIDYQHISVEDLAESGAKFDIIFNMEVIEHVNDIDSFLAASAQLLNEGGIMFVATMNRTITSFMKAIIGAEYLLRWLPIGTHQHSKFVKPSELVSYLEEYKLSLLDLSSMEYNMFKDSWKIGDNLKVNYISCFRK